MPVLRDLLATIDDLAHRQRKCALRPVELGRERLFARADRMPSAEQLLQGHAQKLDDLGERLRRGLVDRAAKGRERLSDLRLSPAILRGNLRAAKQRLTAARLAPSLVTRPISERRERLAALERLRLQLDPKAPLQRGYALVCAEGHPVVKSQAVAAQQPVLTLEFADGTLQVIPAAATRKAPKRPKEAPGSGQPKLL